MGIFNRLTLKYRKKPEELHESVCVCVCVCVCKWKIKSRKIISQEVCIWIGVI